MPRVFRWGQDQSGVGRERGGVLGEGQQPSPPARESEGAL